jgi:hypothetical protein
LLRQAAELAIRGFSERISVELIDQAATGLAYDFFRFLRRPHTAQAGGLPVSYAGTVTGLAGQVHGSGSPLAAWLRHTG